MSVNSLHYTEDTPLESLSSFCLYLSLPGGLSLLSLVSFSGSLIFSVLFCFSLQAGISLLSWCLCLFLAFLPFLFPLSFPSPHHLPVFPIPPVTALLPAGTGVPADVLSRETLLVSSERRWGARDTPVDRGMAQSPAASQVTVRGRLGVPAMHPPPVHPTSSPPLCLP